jgi:hypothetical protein
LCTGSSTEGTPGTLVACSSVHEPVHAS